MNIICIELGKVFGEELGIEEVYLGRVFWENGFFQGFLEAERARGKMTQNNLLLFCGRLGTLAASVSSHGEPHRGRVWDFLL